MILHPDANRASATARELSTQPDVWRRVSQLAAESDLPLDGQRLAVIGCGSSWFAAMAIADLRERAGMGETDAFCSSEFPLGRPYDAVLAISRSGATTETLSALEASKARQTFALVTDLSSPIGQCADHCVSLSFANEESVVQTRFVTASITLGRVWTKHDLEPAIEDARVALKADLPIDVSAHDHYVFLGSGWNLGLAAEAALVVRECAAAWSESHPYMEYRHGPIAAARPGSAVWFLGDQPDELPREVAATGATVVSPALDPLAALIQVQRAALVLAASRGRDVDRPAHLARAVVL